MPEAKTLQDISSDSLLCRDLRHAWEFDTDVKILRNKKKAPVQCTRVLKCSRCKTERHDTFRLPSFELAQRVYVYAENYEATGIQKAGQRVYVQDVRMEWFARLTAGRMGNQVGVTG